MANKTYTPDKTMSLYKGKVTIDFYERYGHYTHVYIVRETDEWPTSVTKATGQLDKSRALLPWAARLSREFFLAQLKKKKKFTEELIAEGCGIYLVKQDEGKDIGTEVHDWIEEYLLGNDPKLPTEERALNGVSAFLEWKHTKNVEFLASEQIVYSRKHGYVGKMDAAVKMDLSEFGLGKKKLISPLDFKTNNWPLNKKTKKLESKCYDEHRYQVAGYKEAFEEERGKFFTGPRLEFSINKVDGTFQLHIMDEDPEDQQEDFECYLGLLKCAKRTKKLAARESKKQKAK